MYQFLLKEQWAMDAWSRDSCQIVELTEGGFGALCHNIQTLVAKADTKAELCKGLGIDDETEREDTFPLLPPKEVSAISDAWDTLFPEGVRPDPPEKEKLHEVEIRVDERDGAVTIEIPAALMAEWSVRLLVGAPLKGTKDRYVEVDTDGGGATLEVPPGGLDIDIHGHH